MAEQGKAKGKVKPIPDGYHTLTPYISVKGAREALAFYKKAFGAQELFHMDMPDGRIGHAELQIGESRFMLADEMPERADAVSRSPASLGGTTCGFMVYVPDVDTAFARAVEAGAVGQAPADRPVLRRSQRHDRRSVRPHLDAGHAHRGRQPGGDEAPHGEAGRRRLAPGAIRAPAVARFSLPAPAFAITWLRTASGVVPTT